MSAATKNQHHSAANAPGLIEVTLRLDADHAAALKRFAERVCHSDARSVLYPHLSIDIRSEQAYQIVEAFTVLDKALAEAGAHSWPWVETGSAEVQS